MPKDTEDLRNAETGADPALTFGLDELIQEMLGDVYPFVDESCEITAPGLARTLGVSVPIAKKKLEKLEKEGKMERVTRRATSGNKVTAWRKK